LRKKKKYIKNFQQSKKFYTTIHSRKKMNLVTYEQKRPQQKMINKICKMYTCREKHESFTQLFKRTKLKIALKIKRQCDRQYGNISLTSFNGFYEYFAIIIITYISNKISLKINTPSAQLTTTTTTPEEQLTTQPKRKHIASMKKQRTTKNTITIIY